ncbi:uncharacterized protein LOC113210117 isoform X2 [Frankliniella occidentalis]|uniref:Uncharacterized protein LOC113210117 isoform X2 n=1 Tax=Frankliniella occidentalis TaxID=133901 RepID=A0A9C6XC05_FRAOC|nr:uncharacterized protein LOC113210117 isoform X2 [Frankliniella occidentalis]
MSQPAGLHTCIRPLPASKGPVCGRPSTWSPPPPLLDPSTAIAREPYILPRTPGTSTVSRHLQSHEHLTMSTQTAMASAGVDECGIRATDAPVCSFYHTTGPETCWDTECPKCGPENRKLVEHPRPAKDESEDQPELPLKKKFKPNPTVAENQTSALSTAQPLQPSSVSSLELLSPSMSTVSTIGTGNDSLSGSDSTVTSTTPCNEEQRCSFTWKGVYVDPLFMKLLVCLLVHMYCMLTSTTLIPPTAWGKTMALAVIGYEAWYAMYVFGTLILYCLDTFASSFKIFYSELSCPQWLCTIVDFKNLHSLVNALFMCLCVFIFGSVATMLKSPLCVVLVFNLLLIYYVCHAFYCSLRVVLDVMYSICYIYHYAHIFVSSPWY